METWELARRVACSGPRFGNRSSMDRLPKIRLYYLVDIQWTDILSWWRVEQEKIRGGARMVDLVPFGNYLGLPPNVILRPVPPLYGAHPFRKERGKSGAPGPTCDLESE